MEGTEAYKGKCLHCSYGCARDDGRWYGLPIAHADETLFVFGYFCTVGCAAAYIDYGVPETLRSRSGDLLHSFLRVNLHKQLVQPAPPRHELVDYGGSLDITAFRAVGRITNWYVPVHRKATQKHFISKLAGRKYALRRLKRLPGVRLVSSSSGSSSSFCA